MVYKYILEKKISFVPAGLKKKNNIKIVKAQLKKNIFFL